MRLPIIVSVTFSTTIPDIKAYPRSIPEEQLKRGWMDDLPLRMQHLGKLYVANRPGALDPISPSLQEIPYRHRPELCFGEYATEQ